MTSDRITEDYDWRDGINQFRLRINQDLEEIFNLSSYMLGKDPDLTTY